MAEEEGATGSSYRTYASLSAFELDLVSQFVKDKKLGKEVAAALNVHITTLRRWRSKKLNNLPIKAPGRSIVHGRRAKKAQNIVPQNIIPAIINVQECDIMDNTENDVPINGAVPSEDMQVDVYPQGNNSEIIERISEALEEVNAEQVNTNSTVNTLTGAVLEGNITSLEVSHIPFNDTPVEQINDKENEQPMIVQADLDEPMIGEDNLDGPMIGEDDLDGPVIEQDDFCEMSYLDVIESEVQLDSLADVSDYDPTRRPVSPPYIGFTEQLKLNLLVVPQPDKSRREYAKVKSLKDKDVYGCNMCLTIIKKEKNGQSRAMVKDRKSVV